MRIDAMIARTGHDDGDYDRGFMATFRTLLLECHRRVRWWPGEFDRQGKPFMSAVTTGLPPFKLYGTDPVTGLQFERTARALK
jgi:hypothetical protein